MSRFAPRICCSGSDGCGDDDAPRRVGVGTSSRSASCDASVGRDGRRERMLNGLLLRVVVSE